MIRRFVACLLLLLATAMVLMGAYTWRKPVTREWQYWRADLPGLVGWKWKVFRGELEITYDVITGTPVPDSNSFLPPVKRSHNAFFMWWEHTASHTTEWSLPAKTYPESTYTFYVPIWSLFVLVLIYPSIVVRQALRRRHRQSRKLCLTCAYSLTGNTSGVCPECGTAISIDSRSTTE